MSFAAALEGSLTARTEPKSKQKGTTRSDSEKARLHLLMSSRSMERLDVLKEKTEATSYAEVFKNALRIYDALVEESEKGNEIMVRDGAGNLTSYKVFL